jgi:hypothetical protein
MTSSASLGKCQSWGRATPVARAHYMIKNQITGASRCATCEA